jgi:hypothetical protein
LHWQSHLPQQHIFLTSITRVMLFHLNHASILLLHCTTTTLSPAAAAAAVATVLLPLLLQTSLRLPLVLLLLLQMFSGLPGTAAADTADSQHDRPLPRPSPETTASGLYPTYLLAAASGLNLLP